MISVITAHQPSRHSLLIDCYRSLRAQDNDWEWLIEIDGDPYPLAEEIVSDHRVSVDYSGMAVGAAGARNLALSRAQGEFLFSLDDDDFLIPNALPRMAAALSDSNCPAAIGNCFKIEDGRPVPWHSHGLVSSELYWPGGIIGPGEITANKDRFGTHCLPSCSVFWRRETLLGLGGWPAIKGSEDTAVLARANARSEILRPDIDVLIYRQHPGQESSDPKIKRLRERNWPLIKEMLDQP